VARWRKIFDSTLPDAAKTPTLGVLKKLGEPIFLPYISSAER
jgi:hypothetical protein